jgi:hypothetical protein
MPAKLPTSNMTLQVRTLQFTYCKLLLPIPPCLTLSQSNCPIYQNFLGTARNSSTSSPKFIQNLPEKPHTTSMINTNSATYPVSLRAMHKTGFSLTSSQIKLSLRLWNHSYLSSRPPLVTLTKWELCLWSLTRSLRGTRNLASTMRSSNV